MLVSLDKLFFDDTAYQKIADTFQTHSFNRETLREGALDYFELKKGVADYLEVYKKVIL